MANRTSRINEWDMSIKAGPDKMVKEMFIEQTIRLTNSSWTKSPASHRTYTWSLDSDDVNSENENRKAMAELLIEKGYNISTKLRCGGTFWKNTPKSNIFVHYCCVKDLIPEGQRDKASREKYLTNIAREKFK